MPLNKSNKVLIIEEKNLIVMMEEGSIKMRNLTKNYQQQVLLLS